MLHFHCGRRYLPVFGIELLSVSGVLLQKFLVCDALKYLEPGVLVQKALRYWFATTERALGLTGLLIA